MKANDRLNSVDRFYSILNTFPLILNIKQENCKYQLFKSMVWIDEGIESRSTDYKADSPTTRYMLLRNTENMMRGLILYNPIWYLQFDNFLFYFSYYLS